ncbi:MAG: hypothetical protein MMC23_003201 [Stictis urceolatum]|nr:hypothetical protein [Stictis urceolata]
MHSASNLLPFLSLISSLSFSIAAPAHPSTDTACDVLQNHHATTKQCAIKVSWDEDIILGNAIVDNFFTVEVYNDKCNPIGSNASMPFTYLARKHNSIGPKGGHRLTTKKGVLRVTDLAPYISKDFSQEYPNLQGVWLENGPSFQYWVGTGSSHVDENCVCKEQCRTGDYCCACIFDCP